MMEGHFECVHKTLDFDLHGQYSVQNKGVKQLLIVCLLEVVKCQSALLL